MPHTKRNIIAFTSAARTASENSIDLKNYMFTGCHAIIDVTEITATGNIIFKIQGKDPESGKYYDLLTSPSITTVSTTILKLYPALTAVANLTVNDGLPMDFRLVATHANAVSMTYSATFNLIF